MGWHGHLTLNYRRDGERCVVHDRHSGPLRVLQSLYPESPAVCHNVLVHPPGGIVGGDSLQVDLHLAQDAHGVITTPGATRFYRSSGELATQHVDAHLADGARLEWLPLETICHRSSRGENRMRFHLAPGAQMIGWDVLALGLPASGEVFDKGRFTQSIELPGAWLERGVIDGEDKRLLDSPLGMAGHRVMATMWFASGASLDDARRDGFLDLAREAASCHPLQHLCGATSPNPRCVVLRVLADRVEPAMQLLVEVWKAWRTHAWALAPCPPRVWRT
ncbi:urease accessory protein UreD [Piscinibacter terrae]|uniref:Urease accessory protein UreD n=1 Tax=Piscinibacter terrae TaxID=2496871 RepID=A0A3N7HSP4_9BURK|nr:urease accessory protein UreD [Albitalea terrae]RQP25310.1 urease accessory protein UreD [Albitalea terrae]